MHLPQLLVADRGVHHAHHARTVLAAELRQQREIMRVVSAVSGRQDDDAARRSDPTLQRMIIIADAGGGFKVAYGAIGKLEM